MSTVRAVIFDWGGTLADYATVELADMWRLAARHIAHDRGVPHREEEITGLLGDAETAFWDRTRTDQRAGSLADVLALAAQRLDVDVGEALLEEAALRHLDAWTPHITHDADAAPTLTTLRSWGLRIGLLSNTHWPRAFHEHFLERDGLAGLIDARLYTSEMSHMKPHPAAFHAALAALDLEDPAEAVFVGDRPYDDVYGAQQAGMRGVLRHNPQVPPYAVEPDARIDTLPALLEHIARWRQPGA